jgi:hypothetical protein
VALLRVLAAWTAGCSTAARSILRNTSNLFLVSLISAKGTNGSGAISGPIGERNDRPTH